ncbi:MAG: GTPase, partial [Elusimicrobiota bacterium]
MTEASAAETPFKSGFVALLGRPNAGKSTLINALLGRKLSIISAKPQTTRHKVLGLLNGKGFQACLLDTPGWLDKAKDALQGALLLSARIAARDDADILVLPGVVLVDLPVGHVPHSADVAPHVRWEQQGVGLVVEVVDPVAARERDGQRQRP